MLSNAYFLASFRFDTAENEPAKKLSFPLALGSIHFPPRLRLRRERPAGYAPREPGQFQDLEELSRGGGKRLVVKCTCIAAEKEKGK